MAKFTRYTIAGTCLMYVRIETSSMNMAHHGKPARLLPKPPENRLQWILRVEVEKGERVWRVVRIEGEVSLPAC
jgi:hypothetical protein